MDEKQNPSEPPEGAPSEISAAADTPEQPTEALPRSIPTSPASEEPPTESFHGTEPTTFIPGGQTFDPKAIPSPKGTGNWPPQPPLMAQKESVLSSTISLAAVGVMALIAAVGVLFAFNRNYIGGSSGAAVLISVGLIVMIAGGVLIYTALKGQRPGWFLPFTIIGAVVSIPVVAIGSSMNSYNSPYYPEAEYGYAGSTWEEEEPFSNSTYGLEAAGSPNNGVIRDQDGQELEFGLTSEDDVQITGEQIEVLDPSDLTIQSNGVPQVLDLTEVAEGSEWVYNVSVDDSMLVILLNEEQLPLIGDSYYSDGGWTIAQTFPTDYEANSQLEGWSSYNFDPSMYINDLGVPGQAQTATGNPVSRFHFNGYASVGTQVVFVVTDKNVVIPGHEITAPAEPAQSGENASGTQQSGAQQTETPQSGVTQSGGNN